MTRISVLLPEIMNAWVEKQVREGQYTDASEYVSDLIHRDQRYKEKQERLEEAIQAGFDSGISTRTREEILAEAKTELRNGI